MEMEASLCGIADLRGAAAGAIISVMWRSIRAVFNPLGAAIDLLAVMDASSTRTGSVPMAACAAALERLPSCLRIVTDGCDVLLCLLTFSPTYILSPAHAVLCQTRFSRLLAVFFFQNGPFCLPPWQMDLGFSRASYFQTMSIHSVIETNIVAHSAAWLQWTSPVRWQRSDRWAAVDSRQFAV